MNTKDLADSPNITLAIPQNQISLNRAKSFKVKTTIKDYSQYVNTIKAYALAGMPFEHIANAGDFLGDEVEKGELDATLQESWKGKVGEIAENEGKILAWQSRGEKTSHHHQLSEPTISGMEVVTVSQDLTTVTTDKTIDVIEGIAVLKQQPQQTIQSSQNSSLENNPYLKALPNLNDLK